MLMLRALAVFAFFLPSSALNESFTFVWQVPHHVCHRQFASKGDDMLFHVSDYGIIENPRDRYSGETNVIFYNFGRFPMYAFSNPYRPDNGGIPQEGDLHLHLADARNDINKHIPNRRFNGLATLNQEEWRPLYQQNSGVKSVYTDKSIMTYQMQHPGESMEAAVMGGLAEFDKWSMNYSIESVKLGKDMRPNSMWGYYAFPYCYNAKVPVKDRCSDWVRDVGNKLKPLWDAVTAVMPSIYLWQSYGAEDRANFIYSQIEEGVRVARLSSDYTPVYVYTKMIYTPGEPYSDMDVYATLRMPADFGVEGAIIWGGTPDVKTKELCKQQKKQFHDVVGPYTLKISKWAKQCAEERCNGKGRCIHRGAVDRQYREEMFRLTQEELFDFTIDDKYECNCFQAYKGKACEAAK